MSFRDLQVGEKFEFDHSSLGVLCGGFAHGPWQKRTARTYVYADQHSTQHFRVGTVAVAVRRGEHCKEVAR